MPNYKFLNSALDWRKGDVASEKEIDDTNLGGTKRLLDLKAIEPTDEQPRRAAESPNTPDNTKGDNVERSAADEANADTVEKRAERRAGAVGSQNDGTLTSQGTKPDNEPTNAGNEPGKVTRTSISVKKNA